MFGRMAARHFRSSAGQRCTLKIWLLQTKTPIPVHEFPILKNLLFAPAYFEGDTDGGMIPIFFNNLNGGYSATELGAESGHECRTARRRPLMKSGQIAV